MDATFGINDVQFHLFTLMVFDAHWSDVPIAWIITSCQTCNNLVEWLTPLKKKLQNNMSRWKPSCFIVHDVPQELWTLQWVSFFNLPFFSLLLFTCKHFMLFHITFSMFWKWYALSH
jgi:hypothetical protein